MDIEVITNGKTETYRNVTHVSVVGNWLCITMATGEWAKLDSHDVTIEIAATDYPIKMWPAEWPATTPEVERLRLQLLQRSIDFMASISDEDLINFIAIERRNIISVYWAKGVRIDNQLLLEMPK